MNILEGDNVACQTSPVNLRTPVWYERKTTHKREPVQNCTCIRGCTGSYGKSEQIEQVELLMEYPIRCGRMSVTHACVTQQSFSRLLLPLGATWVATTEVGLDCRVLGTFHPTTKWT